ncbi:MAG: 3-dehydroquinate dehydratase [Glaciecola sp. HTCC2999]|nr:MAG: 3-dehydroquinate dehydratase [Glaciecola sp. HTCC2999]
MNILILNGPNLNLLGKREPNVYGSQTLEDIMTQCEDSAKQLGHSLSHFQSNAEHDIINAVHTAMDEIDFIVINPGALTHTSIALRDALLGVNIPFIEVHISNVHARESFRHQSYLSDIASGVIVGCGTYGYQLAINSADQQFNHQQQNR